MKIKMLKERTHNGKIVWNEGDIYEVTDDNTQYYLVKLLEDDTYGIIWCGVEKSAIDEYKVID